MNRGRLIVSIFAAALVIFTCTMPWRYISFIGNAVGYAPDEEKGINSINEIIESYIETNDYTDKFDRTVKNFLSRSEINGASFAIMKNGKMLYCQGYGFADTLKREPMRPGTLMRVASVSKLITAAAIMKLCDEGKLSLDRRVFGKQGILCDSTYINAIKTPAITDITVEHLLRHSAGFSLRAGDPMFNIPQISRALGVKSPCSSEDMIRYVLGRPLGFQPGRSTSYSNVGYMILSKIIERVSGTSYEKYVNDNILHPAGCYDMYIAGNLPSQRRNGESFYYSRHDEEPVEALDGSGKLVRRCYGGNDIHGLYGAGGWIASSVELLRFVSTIDGEKNIEDIITPRSFRTMTSRPKEGLPLGWIKITEDGSWLRTGTLSGSNAVVKHTPDGYTWVFISNTSSWRGSRFPLEISHVISEAVKKVQKWPNDDLFVAINNIKHKKPQTPYHNSVSTDDKILAGK